MPAAVRASIEDRLGGPVSDAVSQRAGFSPALAARLALAHGRRVFVKAIGPDQRSGAPGGQDSYRREARIAAALPPSANAADLIDTWEAGGWVILAFEDIDGTNPTLPWRRGDLVRVLEAFTATATALTPTPIAAPAVATPGGGDHWRYLASHSGLTGSLPGLEPWIEENIDLLVELEASSEAAATGDTLVHCDLRADNIVLTPHRVYFVDWPHARVGAPWLDLVYFLPSVAMQGGPPPEELFWRHPLATGARSDDVSAVLAGWVGFMLHEATQRPPPGLPTLRRFQLAQGEEALLWLRQMTTDSKLDSRYRGRRGRSAP